MQNRSPANAGKKDQFATGYIHTQKADQSRNDCRNQSDNRKLPALNPALNFRGVVHGQTADTEHQGKNGNNPNPAQNNFISSIGNRMGDKELNNHKNTKNQT